ncbi:NlpC/P60 family protein [Sphingobium sp. MI1205]|uniref:NlpC/P60 family protein n=1 Tax=Sphingobium sp. MI1205 TaxID=407020 RepID=UPI00076FE569|nr:NlpC/P60 family protein [Sphingobium sp. MI1205]AMK19327.1 phage cell wall peptidase, NlpC/P60 [Sphingobium sp. MI1205]
MRDAIVAEARSWIGTPFHWEASVKGVGCDCKGLVAGVARALGLTEAESVFARATAYHRSIDAAYLRQGLAALFDQAEEARPGDVLLLRVGGKAQHLAILTEPGRMIHTYGKGPKCVVEVPMGAIWCAAIDSSWAWRTHNVD